MKRCAALCLLGLISSVIFGLGCQHPVQVMAPGCPTPKMKMIDELIVMVEREEYAEVRLWFAEVDRYCLALEAMGKP